MARNMYTIHSVTPPPPPPFVLLLVPSNLPEVNQRIIDTSVDTSNSLEHDYPNNPYSTDVTSSPHNQKQLCNLRTFTSTQTKRHQQLTHCRSMQKGNKLNHNGYCHARYTLEIARQFTLHAKSKHDATKFEQVKDPYGNPLTYKH